MNVSFCWSLNIGVSMCRSPCFSGSTQHVLLILFDWFVRWEVSGHIMAILKGIVSRVCSKQHETFLCSSHQIFFSKHFVKVNVVKP